MPTTSQLVRKGRTAPKKKLATPGLKSGKGRKKRVAAPQRRGGCPRVYTTTPQKPNSAPRKGARVPPPKGVEAGAHLPRDGPAPPPRRGGEAPGAGRGGVPHRRGRPHALLRLALVARQRREKSMAQRLAYELLDAQQQQGSAYKRKDDIYRMAQANKAFAHYRW